MALTVSQYATQRGVSESTVKTWIRRLGLDLPENPADGRQRLILIEHKRELDTLGTSKPKPEIRDVIQGEVVPELENYDRSDETGLIIAEGAIVKSQQQIIQRPEDNPLLQALRLHTSKVEASNTQALTQFGISNQANQDLASALNAARAIRIKEQAQQQAIEDYQLKQKIMQETQTTLELMDLGLLGKSQPIEPESESLPRSSPPLSSPESLF
jgi:hypothetical protein